MAWGVLKKIFGAKQEAAGVGAAENKPVDENKAAPAAKPAASAKPAETKKEISVDEQIDAELKNLPPMMRSQVNNPAVRQKIVDLAKRMMKDGVDLKNEKQIKNWIKEHAQELKSGSAEPSKPETYRREEPRVGRNDDCPCGSGKKYKKCCGKT